MVCVMLLKILNRVPKCDVTKNKFNNNNNNNNNLYIKRGTPITMKYSPKRPSTNIVIN